MDRPRFVLLALALLTLVLYLPVRQHAFVLYDDPEYITENPHVRAGITLAGVQWALTTFHAANWHPLTWLSHMLDCELFGLESGAHHLVNVLWHGLNTVLVFLLMQRLLGKVRPAALVAALFAWHPLHIQSVAWAAERKDVLSTCLGLLALLAYVRWARTQTLPGKSASGGLWASVFCFALSLMAKPMLVTLPFLLLLLDFWPLRRLGGSSAPFGGADTTPASQVTLARAVREKWPYFALALLSCVVTYLAQRTGEAVIALEGHTFGARLANAAASYAGYLWKMVWPQKLAVIYPLERTPSATFIIIGVLLLAGVTYLGWRLRHRRPHLLTGWLWYVGLLVPVIGLVQVGGQAMADRYTYLPLVGIFLLLAEEAERIAVGTNRRFVTTGIALVLLAIAASTAWQLRFWRDSETLFARALAVTQRNAVAHVNYGMALEQTGRRTEAREHYASAVQINPRLAQAHNNLANLLTAPDERDRALEHYQAALKLRPGAALTHANLASLLISLGRGEEARQHYAEAERLSPRDARPHHAVAKAWLKTGRMPEGIQCLEKAVRRDPAYLPSLVTLTRVLATAPEENVRNGKRALELATRAAELTRGQHPLVMDTLAAAYAEAGQFSAAVETQRRAIELAEGGEPALLEAMRRRLAQYQSSQPLREPPGSGLE